MLVALAREEGPGSLLVTLKLLSRTRRGEVDLMLLICETLDEEAIGRVGRGVSSNLDRFLPPGGSGNE